MLSKLIAIDFAYKYARRSCAVCYRSSLYVVVVRLLLLLLLVEANEDVM